MNTTASPTFTLALTLDGGISTGAYVAGALSFIVEALDAFEAAKIQHPSSVPQHRVVVKVVCGASAGALTAAAFASALRYDIPPVSSATDEATAARNPLYDSWVNMTDATKLLMTRDADTPGLPSILDGTPLDEVARKVIDFGVGSRGVHRSWLHDPLHVAFAVTTIEGIPFRFGAKAPRAALTRMHGDVLRYAIVGSATRPDAHTVDETCLAFPEDPLDKWGRGWSALANGALGSAAFPAALPPRKVERSFSDYDLVQVLVPGGKDKEARGGRLVPAFDRIEAHDGRFRLTAADGGLIDNDPVDIARDILNDRDPTAWTPRDGKTTSAAVLMIDPMTGDATEAKDPPGRSVFGDLSKLPDVLIDQARFRPVEVALAQEPGGYSRFVIAPLRGGDYGEESSENLAGASCGGFGGYLARAFMRHDFLLGRHNARDYLARRLSLPADGYLASAWADVSDAVRAHFVADDGELPIIPLVGSLHPKTFRETLPPWPRGAADLHGFGDSLEIRLQFIWDRLLATVDTKSLGAKGLKLLADIAWVVAGKAKAREAVVEQVRKLLHEHDLL